MDRALVGVVACSTCSCVCAVGATRATADPTKGVPEGVKHITFFVLGSNRSKSVGGFYTTMDEWPAVTPTDFYMHADGVMRLTPDIQSTQHSFDYDPAHPVPTLGGSNLEIPCGPKIQNTIENRSDVLLFTSEPLLAALPVVGKLTVTLRVSSANVNDTDWTAKLSDVYPDGTSHLIQDGILRMRWRKKTLEPVPIVPNEIETIVVDLWTTAYVFDKGHSIRVAVSSSNSPRFLVNPNTGLPLSVRHFVTHPALTVVY
jgi:putative CocE/NonD family hydrolase